MVIINFLIVVATVHWAVLDFYGPGQVSAETIYRCTQTQGPIPQAGPSLAMKLYPWFIRGDSNGGVHLWFMGGDSNGLLSYFIIPKTLPNLVEHGVFAKVINAGEHVLFYDDQGKLKGQFCKISNHVVLDLPTLSTNVFSTIEATCRRDFIGLLWSQPFYH
jgi:hypothetical protein